MSEVYLTTREIHTLISLVHAMERKEKELDPGSPDVKYFKDLKLKLLNRLPNEVF